MHVLLRELPLRRKHFFEWSKTAISSTTCGTVTSKSLLSQAFSVPYVHPRLRKRLARCTLDCGFKTPESPALRGFVGERCPIRGTSLYLVLKSNGLPYPKIQLKKFSFHQNCSRKYLQKVAATTLFQTVPHRVFQLLAQTAHVCFRGRKWVHTRPSEKNRTQGLTRRITGISDGGGIITLGAFHTVRKPCVARG